MEIIAENVAKFFGESRIFRNINFNISSGQAAAIIGPNGSGKTTLVRVLSGLISPSEGRVRYKNNGAELQREDIYKYIGLVGPYLELYQDLSAEENLNFFAKMKNLPNAATRISQLMEQFGLSGREDDPVKAYSSGMKQRLKYVFALMHDPQVLFVDEPRSNLDEQGIAAVYRVLEEHKKNNILVIATNESDDLKFADFRVAVHA